MARPGKRSYGAQRDAGLHASQKTQIAVLISETRVKISARGGYRWESRASAGLDWPHAKSISFVFHAGLILGPSEPPLHSRLALENRHDPAILGTAGEVVAIMHETLREVPEGLRAHAGGSQAERAEVGSHRVSPLKPKRLVALGAAAVVGEAFDLNLVGAVAGKPVRLLLQGHLGDLVELGRVCGEIDAPPHIHDEILVAAGGHVDAAADPPAARPPPPPPRPPRAPAASTTAFSVPMHAVIAASATAAAMTRARRGRSRIGALRIDRPAVDGALVRREMLEHEHAGAYWRALVEVDHILVQHADAAGGDIGADCPGLGGAMDAVD